MQSDKSESTDLADELLAEYREAQREAHESGKVARNSYGHGYDCGYREGIRRALTLARRGEVIND